MSPPVGPTGLPQTCDGDHDRRWRVGAGVAAFDTTIKFRDAGFAAFQQLGVAASLDRRLGERFTLQLALGSALAGHVVRNGVEHRVKPGPLASLALSVRLLDDGPKSPFVVTTLSIAQSFVRAGDASLRASDARLGLAIGKTIGPVAPFVVARTFGGPVYFLGDVGTDRYRYQVGAGLLVFGKGLDAAVEVAFLGERRITVGAGWTF